MIYLKETKICFFFKEDLFISRIYEVPLKSREYKEIKFISSSDNNFKKIDSNKVIEDEI